MLTVGLVKELYFIANILKSPAIMSLNLAGRDKNSPVEVFVFPDSLLTVYYKGKLIWSERVEGETSFFGIESCDSISRAIACLDNNDPSWEKYTHFEKA
jgi:hypothetical protein